MKRIFTHLSLAIIILLSAVSLNASAQASTSTAAPFSTPTSTTPIPTQASDASIFLCAGSPIKLAPSTVDASATKFEWYKYDSNNNAVLVQTSTSSTYALETAPTTGYYKYKLVQINSNNCSSPASEDYIVYVLPPFTPAITAASTTVCEKGQTSSLLTATGQVAGYTYTYQWNRAGVAISGATASTYTVNETGTVTTVTPVDYTVTMSYALNPGCTKTSAAQTITIIPAPAKPTINFVN